MNYQVIVKKYNDEYILYIKELSLIHKSKDLEKGYQEINKKKQEILKSIDDYDLPKSVDKKSNNIKNYIIKSSVIFLGLTFLISFSGIKILTKFNEVVVDLDKKISLNIVKEKIISEISSLSEASEEKQSERMEKIKVIVKNLKPYYKELIKIND